MGRRWDWSSVVLVVVRRRCTSPCALAGTAAPGARRPVHAVIRPARRRLAWPARHRRCRDPARRRYAALAVAVGCSCGACATPAARVDRAAALHGWRGRDIEAPERRKSAHGERAPAWASRLHRVADRARPCGGQPLFGSWEDMHVDIWGPRTGKTTSRAVPAILDAPGAVLVTSNKRDVVDATRDVRGRAARCGCSTRRASPARTRLVVEPARLRHRRSPGRQARRALRRRSREPGARDRRVLRPRRPGPPRRAAARSGARPAARSPTCTRG